MRGNVIGERYRLERQLGQGSMAEVWLATDLELERPVALKLLAPDADRIRFEREARAAAALSHPNVTRIYDYGEYESRPYMALEYLPGRTLEERLHPGRPLSDDDAAAIAAQLAAGLAHAHEQGLVHRDLKPANVLFDEADRPKIADFGIARIGTDSTLTEAGTVLGTAAYISPEQAAGEPATPASDVYSFGVLLFRMLTGRLPFEAESPLELVEMHRRLEAPPVEILRPEAPSRLASVAAAALARNPRDRPADGAALAAELGVDTPRSVASTSAPTLIIPRPPQRRTRLIVAIAGLVFAAAAGTVGALLLTRTSSTTPATTAAHSTQTKQTSTLVTPTAHTTKPTTLPTTSTPPVTTAPLPTTVSPPTTTAVPPPTTLETTATIPNPGG